MGDVEAELKRCDAEIARCWNHECKPGEAWGVLLGWADWNVERMLIEEQICANA